MIRSGHGKPTSPRWRVLKRLLDLAIAIPTLVAIAPILLVAIAFVRLSSPGSALFHQVRIGQNGTPFLMLKLRTMYIDKDDTRSREVNMRELLGTGSPSESGIFKLGNDTRILPIGHFLRSYSIDELPQLLNVLRGEMSIV